MGQQHVVKALQFALREKRLHHAYLFTGTRGVGKTTLARIIAKALNCEQGISADPCLKCNHCQEIESGRFFDLLEVDAASRTKVEDTRELLENVQYAPTKGRYKIYLIDEVHMLSGHSFNALLKTLEEPPPHVIFLLATTDPQRLPVTVLSRCLQFHLKNLSPEQIKQQLAHILDAEKIAYETEATYPIAVAAQGSLRDALSLLDQAIALGDGQITQKNIQQMLGLTESTLIIDLLNALATQNAQTLLEIARQIAECGNDFANTLDELLSYLHQISLAQFIPDGLLIEQTHATEIKQLALQMKKEDVQLYYQIGLIGRRDLSLAPNPRVGFEMALLRMLAFTPSGAATNTITTLKSQASPQPNANPRPQANSSPQLIKQPITQPTQVAPTKAPQAIPTQAVSAEEWAKLIKTIGLKGPTLALAIHCSWAGITDETIRLTITPEHAPLVNKTSEERLRVALSEYWQKPIKLTIQVEQNMPQTPAQFEQKKQEAKKASAHETLLNDPKVQYLMNAFDGQIVTSSIENTENEL